MSKLRFIVIDGNPPWVRSPFLAMRADDADVYFLRVYNIKYLPEMIRAWRDVFRWKRISPNAWKRYVFVPGWTRFAALSDWLTATALRRLPEAADQRTATVFSAPHYRDLLKAVPAGVKLYYVSDTLGTFGWDFEPIVTWEKEMVSQCDAVITVSKQIADDLDAQTQLPVMHSPNAVAESFIEEIRRIAHASDPSTPEDMNAIPKPIVGCTGQINHSYDWRLIADLAEALPETSFVFVGPRTRASAETEATITKVLERRNIFWLGPKQHSELPRYLASFDICFNPLAMNEDNDRRSPLRLFDYMATDKPILSTAIAEALLHQEHITCVWNEGAAIAWIREMSGLKSVPNAAARRDYLRNHTWGARARALLDFVEERTAGNTPAAL